MARKRKKYYTAPFTAKQALGVSAALLGILFVLTLLNEAMGTHLPLPSVAQMQAVFDKMDLPGVEWVDEILAQSPTSGGGLAAAPTQVEGDLKVHYIDVGQGDCQLIQAPEQNILIDAGDQGLGDEIIEYLEAQGVERIDLLIATHPHADHIGSMAEVVDHFEIGEVLFAQTPNSLLPTSKTYERLLDSISNKGLQITKAQPGNRYDLGGGAVLDILGPQREYLEDLNDNSVVCRLIFGETGFLFTGDAGEAAEEDLLNVYDSSDLQADILKLGHHGSSTANTSSWLKAVNPKYAVASCGKDNSYGHPHQEVVQRLEEMGISLWRTDQTGTIVVGSDGANLDVQMERQAA